STQGGSTLQDLHFDRINLRQTGVPHAVKFTWDYQVPVGRGQRFGTNMGGLMDGILGGWDFAGTGRVQTSNFLYRGILHNMTASDVQKAFKIRIVKDPTTGVTTVYDMPQDIIDNTLRAYSTSDTSTTGYGTLGPPDPTSRYMGPAAGPGCLYIL